MWNDSIPRNDLKRTSTVDNTLLAGTISLVKPLSRSFRGHRESLLSGVGNVLGKAHLLLV